MVTRKKNSTLTAIALATLAMGLSLAPSDASANPLERIFGRPQPRQQQPRYRPVAPAPAPRYQQQPQYVQPTRALSPVAAPAPMAPASLAPVTTLPPNDQAAVDEFRRQPGLYLPVFVTVDSWSDWYEAEYSRWIAHLGRAVRNKKCNSVKSCMQNPEANLIAHTDPKGFVFYADCADLPYFLRAYFAHKAQLPFSFVNEVSLNQQPYSSEPTRNEDLPTARLDNSPYGNAVVARGGSNVVSGPGYEKHLIPWLERMIDTVSTRTLRVGPLSPNYGNGDFYPVRLDRTGIGPGTVVHSTGHVGVVFEVDPKGTIHMIDAHPDGSLTYKIVKTSTLDRSRPDHGLGFYRFRPLRLVGAQRHSNNALYGGKIVAATDQELHQRGLYSLEQFFGPEANIAPGTPVAPDLWKRAFKNQSFFDLLDSRLRDPNVRVQADEDIVDLLESLCNEFRQRVEDVDLALTRKANLNREPHPSELPANIYSTNGAWEDYSTPGRDSRMKMSVHDLVDTAITKFRQAKSGHPRLRFDGSAHDYVNALVRRMKDMDRTCVISYLDSRNQSRTLNFTQVINRLTQMSFDPYHCAEKRWGDVSPESLERCVDQDRGHQWYNAQQGMRYVVGKTDANERLKIRSDRPVTLGMLADGALYDQPSEAAINLGTKIRPFLNPEIAFQSPDFFESLTRP